MTPPPIAARASPATVARRYALSVVLLAGAFAAITIMLTPASLRTTAIRFVAIALVGVLVAQGRRWARLLFVLLTGLAALYAAVLAAVGPMAVGWRAVFAGYGLGTLWGLWGLFRAPATAHFVAPSAAAKDGA